MNKKLITVLCIIAVFIPTFIAIGYYISAQKQPVNDRAVETLRLTAVDGREYFFDKNSTDDKGESKKMISFFISMNDKSKSVASIPQEVTELGYMTATYNSYNKDRVYKYYFTSDPASCFFADDHNKYYSISSEDAKEFLLGKYSESVYEGALEPTLTLADGSVVKPSNIQWMYKNLNSEYVPTYSSGDHETSQSFPIAGGLKLNFTEEPDYITVKITRDDTVLFDDLYTNLNSSIIGETISTLNVEVRAKWYEELEGHSYGDAVYNFVANVSAPAYFYLGKDTVEQGDVVAITGKNITDVNSISFSSEPSINYTPEFFVEGDYVIALVPISLDTQQSGQYVFTLTTGGQVHNLTLNVAERKQKSALSYNIAAEVANRTRNSVTIETFKNAVKATSENNDPTRYFSGQFLEPLANRSIKTGFGRMRNVVATGEQYMHTGVDYVVASGDTVRATNKGKVVYVGEQVISGKLVVIDHGCGLKSWYMHMGEISVNMGDIVESGAVLGTVGAGGFTEGLNCHYELTVNGISVNPYSLWDEGIKMYLGE